MSRRTQSVGFRGLEDSPPTTLTSVAGKNFSAETALTLNRGESANMRLPLSLSTVIAVQGVCGLGLVAAILLTPAEARIVGETVLAPVSQPLDQPIPRQVPLVIEPLHDDPTVVSDEELIAVLKKVQPRFQPEKLRPNLVEHALRTWWIKSEFRDPAVMSGVAMKDYLTDHGRYLAAWGVETDPLLLDRDGGIAIRWGQTAGASVHHDHWLASLTEAGIHLDDPVMTPNRHDGTIRDVLHRALLDFRLDETEVEWSAMAFGLWLAPVKEWRTLDGRRHSFDDLATRLIRGHRRFGVCTGTHRVYSLAVLMRLDDDHKILSPQTRADVENHLLSIRDLIAVSQREDGRWPGNWWDGAVAAKAPLNEPLYKQVIATGHHLEWMAIVPEKFHIPRGQIRKAADWIIRTTVETPDDKILDSYTFFSHVGNALALWRKTHPCDAWAHWESQQAR